MINLRKTAKIGLVGLLLGLTSFVLNKYNKTEIKEGTLNGFKTVAVKTPYARSITFFGNSEYQGNDSHGNKGLVENVRGFDNDKDGKFDNVDSTQMNINSPLRGYANLGILQSEYNRLMNDVDAVSGAAR